MVGVDDPFLLGWPNFRSELLVSGIVFSHIFSHNHGSVENYRKKETIILEGHGGTMIFPFSTFMIMGGRVLFILLFVVELGHRHHDIIGRFLFNECKAPLCIEEVSLQRTHKI